MKDITKQMIENGLNQNIIKPVLDDDGELICKIGDNWFYFGGHEFENTDPSEIPFDILVNEILFVLNDFRNLNYYEDEYLRNWDCYEDEYLYYYYYLTESIH